MQTKIFVLTGGPQSGKTSAMRALQTHFGTKLLCLPEVATPLIRELWPEAQPNSANHDVWVKSLQRGIFHTQLGLEEIARARAASENYQLIGQDRGVFDNAAYLRITGRELADQFGESYSHLMSQYHLVIHLETQARSAPASFGSATNSARFETAEAALELDDRLWEAWCDHPHHVHVPAGEDMATKIESVLNLVEQLLD